jgi:Heparinase II/III-like protein/Heparinase II/III N-terminus
VKVPWELSRCQHLPWLAWAYALVPIDDVETRDRLLREFEDQILDFVASNPPQFGVNWCCTMDVAIRAANWLLTYDLFRSFGATLAPEFEHEFKRTLVAHGRHIVNNLEWLPHLRSNHYLANVCGLLYVAAYLPACNETNAWLSIAASELIRECRLQFNPDGSNFEGSTSYHRLSGEMAIYSMAMLKALGDARLNQAAVNGLAGLVYKGPGPNPAKFVAIPQSPAFIPWREVGTCAAGIVRFARAVRHPDGAVAQFGDNDNGRFFKLSPALRLETGGLWHEEPNNHDHLCAAADALVGFKESPVLPDGIVVRSLIGSDGIAEEAVCYDGRNSNPSCFADFGLYVYRTSKVWLAVRCGSVGQRDNGGHAHNDQLAIELALDGVSLIVDPGTYLYTPLPERRNQFRSTRFHNTVVTDKEQNEWLPGQLGLFSMTRVAATRVIECNGSQFVGEHSGFGSPCRRLIRCGADSIEIVDSFDGTFSLTFQFAPETCIEFESDRVFLSSRHGVQARFEFDSGVGELLDSHVSTGYGQLQSAPAVRMSGLSKSVCWRGTIISRADNI